MIEFIALIISLVSLIISVNFAVIQIKDAKKANELSESQKAMAMLSLIQPLAGDDERAWQMLIDYVLKKKMLPELSDDDCHMLQSLVNRMGIKVNISRKS